MRVATAVATSVCLSLAGLAAAQSASLPPAVAAPEAVQVRQLQQDLRAAQDAADAAAVVRASRRLLELYPNEPIAQAALYQLSATAADQSGRPDLASAFGDAARAIDPAVAERGASTAGATRGGGNKLAKMQAALTVALATISAVQEARAMMRPQAPPPGAMAPAGMPPGGAMPGPMPAQYQQYPQAPVGAPGYQMPPAPQPYPGYGPPPGQPPVGTYYQGGPPPGPAPAMSPYGAPPQYAAMPMRGAAFAPIKVQHDHAQSGDGVFFGKRACAALIAVEGGNLTFTPAGGEAPLVVPSTDIVDIALNTVVGTQAGAFHVLTRRGLYLHLAPATADPKDGRAAVDALRAALKL